MACSKISDKISGNQKDDTKIEEEKRMRLFERVNTKIRSNPWDSPELNLLESPMKPSSVSADKVQVRGRGWIPKNKTMDHFESAFFRPVSPETHYSEDLELLDEKCSEDEDRKNYRILQVPAGLFMCKFSNLVFEMEGKVKVLYRIVSWNCCNLDGLGQKQPAGPLYNIKCPEGSIHRLHLPHCETRTVRTPPRLDTVTGADFVDKHSEKLIQRVLSVMEIADYLKGKEMISNEMYSNIKAKATQQDKMRELYTCLDSGGRSVKAEFYKILREKEPFIVDDLESGSSLELRTPLSI